MEYLPVFGICGHSGSGKTTVIEELVRRLSARNLKIGVVKHSAHGFDIDRAGKDSDRFFEAGADVIMEGPEQGFLRAHAGGRGNLWRTLKLACPYYDLVLVEGYKATQLPNKVWLLKDSDETSPAEASDVKRVFRRDENRVDIIMEMIDVRLPAAWLETPVCAGVLVGGKASRMGEPKHLIKTGGATWLERIVAATAPLVEQTVILGQAAMPESLSDLAVLPDAPGVSGPLAGMLSAMRWRPLTSWIFLACDLPRVSSRAVEWLLSTRAPGVWATMPKLPGVARGEPLLAHYDFRARHILEETDRPADVAGSPKVISPSPGADIASAWTNVNTPEELRRLKQQE